MPDGFEQWRAALAGEKQPIYEDTPWCGYFKILDRSNDATAPKGTKRPWVPCAIYIDADGNWVAEKNGRPVPVMAIWPYVAKSPIAYADYKKMHEEKKDG